MTMYCGAGYSSNCAMKTINSQFDLFGCENETSTCQQGM